MAVAITRALPHLGTLTAHSLIRKIRGAPFSGASPEFEMNLKQKNLLTALFLVIVAVGLYVWAIRQVIDSVGHP